MIQVETSRPVFSNLTAEEKKARNKKIGEKARGIYTKAKDSGILSSLENLYLKSGSGSGSSNTGTNVDPLANVNVNVPPVKEPMSKTTKGILIGVGVLAVGVAVWYFAIRKK
jgi:hypothetical protein